MRSLIAISLNERSRPGVSISSNLFLVTHLEGQYLSVESVANLVHARAPYLFVASRVSATRSIDEFGSQVEQRMQSS